MTTERRFWKPYETAFGRRATRRFWQFRNGKLAELQLDDYCLECYRAWDRQLFAFVYYDGGPQR